MREWRINLIFCFIFLFGVIIAAKLFSLQIIQRDFYGALARGQQSFFAEIEGARGRIYLQDREENLYPVALNKTEKICFISLNEVADEGRIINELERILKLPKEELLEKIKSAPANFLIIKEGLESEKAEELEALNLAGVYIAEQESREYPERAFASNLIGFVNKDGIGQYGVEQFYDDVLSGKIGALEGERGPAGYLFLSENDNLEGADLILTIDYNIQFQAEKFLTRAFENLKIEKGQIIVMEPQTGKIFALAQFPVFDANLYFEQDLAIFKNSAIHELFEPGSVFKPVTVAAALNEGKITPQTVYKDSGIIEVGGRWIENYEGRVYPGDVSMVEVLEKSINTGAVFIERQLGHQKFLEYIDRFGIFEKTGIDLPAEIFSLNEEFRKGYEINFITASFGQGIAMTPLQLVRAFSAIANGGNLVNPHVVDKIVQKKGSFTPNYKSLDEIMGGVVENGPETARKNALSAETSSKLTAMLISVVENGFAKSARIPGYYVAGKTGTAQIPFTAFGVAQKGYSEKTWQSFIGYAPALKPRFLILIKLDAPQTKTAEYSAVPIFQDLAKYIIDYWQIPPDYE